MLDVFFTVDTEVWAGGWNDIEGKFPDFFSRYVHGRTPQGSYGLPYKLGLLNAHGLRGVFFVEPLFATRIGPGPLEDIVGMIKDAGQEVQLHLHTEWVHVAKRRIFENNGPRKQYMRNYSAEEQTTLVALGLELLEQAGAPGVNAFRAGGFGINEATLPALEANGIRFDSSYNAAAPDMPAGMQSGAPIVEPQVWGRVVEYPVTVFDDGTRALRPAQLTAASFTELEGLLWQALETGRKSFVIVSHNFELLTSQRDLPDPLVIRRFRKLCEFLNRNRDCFVTRGFRDLEPKPVPVQPRPLKSPYWRTGVRVCEQAYRRVHERLRSRTPASVKRGYRPAAESTVADATTD